MRVHDVTQHMPGLIGLCYGSWELPRHPLPCDLRLTMQFKKKKPMKPYVSHAADLGRRSVPSASAELEMCRGPQ